MKISSKTKYTLDRYNNTYETILKLNILSINKFFEYVRTYKTNNNIDKIYIDMFLGEYYNKQLIKKEYVFLNNIIYTLFINFLNKNNIQLKNNYKNLTLIIK